MLTFEKLSLFKFGKLYLCRFLKNKNCSAILAEWKKILVSNSKNVGSILSLVRKFLSLKEIRITHIQYTISKLYAPCEEGKFS